MKRPKNCNGCKAFYQSQWRYSCELGHELKLTKTGSIQGEDIITPSPAGGQCPKPRTYKELFAAQEGAGATRNHRAAAKQNGNKKGDGHVDT